MKRVWGAVIICCLLGILLAMSRVVRSKLYGYAAIWQLRYNTLPNGYSYAPLLERMGDAAVPLLREEYSAGDDSERFAIIHILGAMRSRKAVDLLIEIIEHRGENPCEKAAALWEAVANFGDSRVTEYALTVVQEPQRDLEVRRMAIEALIWQGAWQYERPSIVLNQFLHRNPQDPIIGDIIWFLSLNGEQKFLSPAIRYAKNTRGRNRVIAIGSIFNILKKQGEVKHNQLGREAICVVVQTLTGDHSAWVQSEVCWQLRKVIGLPREFLINRNEPKAMRDQKAKAAHNWLVIKGYLNK